MAEVREGKVLQMTDRSELLKEAEAIAKELGDSMPATCQGGVAAATIRTLADIVETYDGCDAELLAACRTCDEAIEEYHATPTNQSGPGSVAWITLRAAGHLAKRAVELADKAKGGA